ncbi:uncharacterized protein PHACADRAFT_197951 [Phanerochaete carnosa HHB-10118-sp]|uniref:Uncharacterized protein n=1 Tax=Phanerochaete carnosa (strain HHB-10118-sp) TaxID=650164 RepID=K5W3L7_PHACS|nr:uncharacterized protein PHACADRAFT_197951 [Phanerochaete carnosa HHB-10118-sp]EKM53519.1 hypothetical protein PHACADRAFT_197951 [Phanerochaete carnosa HHB-10118-sp]
MLAPNYSYVHLSVFYETLRLFLPVPGVPKFAAEDATLVATYSSGNKVAIPVPQGSGIVLCIPGLHHNRTPSRIGYASLALPLNTLLEGPIRFQAGAVPRQ